MCNRQLRNFQGGLVDICIGGGYNGGNIFRNKRGVCAMNLGDTIYRLRTERNLSQGELADALGVSRQSISKWETNSSVPELDKLIRMCELFGVSMDELVRGRKEEAETPPAPSVTVVRDGGPNRKTVALVLFCLSAAVWLVFTLLGGFLEGLVFATPFLLCGLTCLIFKRNIGLWCVWVLFCTVNMFLRYATGITWRLTLFSLQYEPSMNYARLAVAWVEVACVVALLVVTVVRLGKQPLAVTKKRIVWLVVGWVFYGLSWIRLSFDPLGIWGNLYYYLSDWVQFILCAVVLTYTVRLIRGWKWEKQIQ